MRIIRAGGQGLSVRLEPLDDHDEWVAAYEASFPPEQVAARGLNQSPRSDRGLIHRVWAVRGSGLSPAWMRG